MQITWRSSYFKVAGLVVSAVALLIAFQNCGKVQIQSPNTDLASTLKSGTGYLCLPSGYTMDTFFVTNLNAGISKNHLLVDTDGDGLSDADEAIQGTDPLKRRTNGKILDSICAAVDYGVNCAQFNVSCNMNENSFGINECDIIALNLNQNAQVGVGIDSDKDGIPDYLEIRINSFPNVNDAYNDLDFDLLNTLMEAEQQTSVRNSNANMAKKDYIKVTKAKVQNPDCTGEYWKIDIDSLPIVPVGGYVDYSTGLIDMSHAANENILIYFLKTRPINSTTAASKSFSGVQKVRYTTGDDSKINFDQSVLFSTGDIEQ